MKFVHLTHLSLLLSRNIAKAFSKKGVIMTKFLIVTSLLLSATQSFAVADGTWCSNARGTVQYETVHLIMGVPPRPGEKRSWTKLTVEGQTFEDQKVEFSKEKQVRKPIRTPDYLIENYTTTLVAAPFMDAAEIREIVLCQRSTYTGRPIP